MEFPFLSPQVLPGETSKLKFTDSHLKTSSQTYTDGDCASIPVSRHTRGKTTGVFISFPPLNAFRFI